MSKAVLSASLLLSTSNILLKASLALTPSSHKEQWKTEEGNQMAEKP